MKRLALVLFLQLACFIGFFVNQLLAAGSLDAADYAKMADVGLSVLEIALVSGLFGTSSIFLLIIRLTRQGTKSLMKTIDSNPDISNEGLLDFAKEAGERKAEKLLKKLVAGDLITK